MAGRRFALAEEPEEAGGQHVPLRGRSAADPLLDGLELG
jgi:hypothetical protein